jgi:hypothetical protein
VLLEAIVALGVLTVGFLGVLTLVNRSIGLNRVVADNYTGNYLAAEGIEVVKNILDRNVIIGASWNAGVAAGCYLVTYDSRLLSVPSACGVGGAPQLRFDSVSKRFSYAGSVVTNFRRVISVAQVGADELRVNSTVSWQTRGGSYQVILEDHFLNWRP